MVPFTIFVHGPRYFADAASITWSRGVPEPCTRLAWLSKQPQITPLLPHSECTSCRTGDLTSLAYLPPQVFVAESNRCLLAR